MMKNKRGISAVVATVLIILITVAAVTIIWAAIIPMINDALENNTISDESFEKHWACMDGCFNMLEVIYTDIDYDNESSENYHSECSDKCYKMYMEEKYDIE